MEASVFVGIVTAVRYAVAQHSWPDALLVVALELRRPAVSVVTAFFVTVVTAVVPEVASECTGNAEVVLALEL